MRPLGPPNLGSIRGIIRGSARPQVASFRTFAPVRQKAMAIAPSMSNHVGDPENWKPGFPAAAPLNGFSDIIKSMSAINHTCRCVCL
jgi:hypothetical protein